ncbi:hypothetical protein BD324DRAFT_654664 [Kockovaella imperatae]|uniref:Uncharacterized protein n=1 Tax=Kockovaella imperatae TaxID=4999 RepID=A0A1Y1UST3_9TREE|nr:hypothetical protein BD324DRAFT_654664 [Kockovaella imperatae]ORX41071.1 hypothetical protein BD324DRAFT_654664 [Kockovaella imperatae]
MSQYPLPSDIDTPSRLFGGAARQSSNRRIHQISSPYSRPASYTGPSASTQGGDADSTFGSPAGASGSRAAGSLISSASTRDLPHSVSTSTVASGMTRSGSLPSLTSTPSGGIISGFKSIFSRPLQWLATPSRGTKRDADVEDQESPVTQRRANGHVEPATRHESRLTHTNNMLPPLPPNVVLSPRNRVAATRGQSSRLLHTVRSLPHLDPPGSVFNTPSTSTRTSGVLTRSRRVNTEEMDEAVQASDNETWSPWKDRNRAASPRVLPPRSATPSKRGSAAVEHPLPSQSPFRPTRSPSQRANGGGLARSNTTANTTSFARAGSVMSDISMGKESMRSPRRGASMLFGQREDNMSVDGDRPGSSLGFFARERWESGSARPDSPMRNGTPQRRGQLIWDAEKGFIREDELSGNRAAAKLVGKNEAERILFALEAQRSTPLRSASPIVPGGSLPPELIGASSRTLRQAISVPLATAMAGETARGRRDKDRSENKASMMISPYGRRRQVDDATRDQRRSETRQRDEESTASSEPRQLTPSDRTSRGETDFSMHSESEAEVAPTPRRSSRNKRREQTPEQTTPKARKTGKGKAAGASARESKQDSPTKSTRRSKRHAERVNSPAPPEADKSVPPVPAVPTITETAPSPDTKSHSTYAPRAEGEVSREASSLRAKSNVTKRTHTASVSLSNSRATSPSSSGRFSAKEEDLPPMEELEAPKIPFNSFSGVSFALDKPAPKTQTSTPTSAPPAASTNLSSRIGPAKNDQSSLNVPNRVSSGPLSRINSSRPRASSPLASGSIVAAPESPPSVPAPPAEPPAGGIFPLSSSMPSTTPTKPPPSSLFAGIGSNDAPKKSLGSGLGKPPQADSSSSEVPDFFGRKAQANSGTSTSTTSPFNFGVPSAPPQPTPAAPFSFGAQASTSGSRDASITPAEPAKATPAASSPFSFGTPAAAPTSTSKPAFSFGSSSAAPSSQPAEPSKPFGGFTFGQQPQDTAKPAPKRAGDSSGTDAGFSFSKPAESTRAAAKPAFSFGTTSAPAPPAPAHMTSEPSKPAFTFGAPPSAEKSKDDAPKPSGFTFGAPANTTPAAAPAAAPSFTFGKPTEAAAAAPTFGFGSTSTTPSSEPKNNPFGGGVSSTSSFGGFGSAAPAANATSSIAPSTSSPFGSTPSAAPASTGFTFGAPSITAPPANPFGGASASSNPQVNSFGGGSSTPTNPFGQSPMPTPSPGTGSAGFNFNFGAAPSAGNGVAAAPSPSFAFGQSSQPSPSTPSSTPFQFGAGSTPQSTGSTFGFGNAAQTTPGQSQPFVFGGAGGAVNGAQNNAPRFGSPGPGGPPPESPGGFSMGAAPESPSGRKIKPLRRAKR